MMKPAPARFAVCARRTVTMSPACNSFMYEMCWPTTAIPRFAERKYDGERSSALHRCHVASSNLPTYHPRNNPAL
jgi:hypothetical protein